MDASVLIVFTAVVVLVLAAIVVMALFKKGHNLRITATVILVIGLIVREFGFGTYARGLREYGQYQPIDSDIYRDGIIAIVTYCYQSSIYVVAVSILLVVLSITCYRYSNSE